MPILDTTWSLRRTGPDAISDPTELDRHPVVCQIDSHRTVACALAEFPGSDSPNEFDIDDFDWWYRCEFTADSDADLSILTFEGLATLAQVWLNGEEILSSRNMFVSHNIDVTALIAEQNILTIAFRSVGNSLQEARPRPRWKTNLVDHQQLRWIRTTLLGRIPGWTPKIRAIGPWRDILFEQDSLAIDECRVSATTDGDAGMIDVEITLRASQNVESAVLELGSQRFPLEIKTGNGKYRIADSVSLAEVSLWNPHTHGKPTLYDYRVVLSTNDNQKTVQSGRIGFRKIALIENDTKFAFEINGQEIFCRGACWTTVDVSSLNVGRTRLRDILEIAADAGANMIRIGGTMVYENDDFYDLCNELGIMVWQDFMFANMDYPIDDDDFRENVVREVHQQVRRLSTYACVTAFCGNSEVEQQAAMFGRSPDDYRNELFYTVIPGLISESACVQPYVASSPFGGGLPFHNSSGVSHYFGIGAYKRPLSDAMSTKILFSTECLGFSNTPSDDLLREAFGSSIPVTHSPQWKAGVPRDSNAGWDFEDIRDHYFEELSGQNAATVRYSDNAGYLARSATVSGEVMRRTYAHWRTNENICGGALVWNMMDIVPGAGWGFVDCRGRRKPVFYYLKRAWSSQCLSLTDNGLDGICISLINESFDELRAKLDIQVLRHPRAAIAHREIDIALASRTHERHSVDEAIGHFLDTTYSYRFGPLGHNVVVVTLVKEDGTTTSDALFPGGYTLPQLTDADIAFDVSAHDDRVEIKLTSDSFLQDVVLRAAGYEFSDNYFHLAPGISKAVTAKPIHTDSKRFRGRLDSLNLSSGIVIK